MRKIAWIVLVVNAIGVIGAPFLIGETNKITAWDVVIHMVRMAAIVPLCGCILGWW